MSALEARLFDSPPCPPEIYFIASETRVQPDLLVWVFGKIQVILKSLDDCTLLLSYFSTGLFLTVQWFYFMFQAWYVTCY